MNQDRFTAIVSIIMLHVKANRGVSDKEMDNSSKMTVLALRKLGVTKEEIEAANNHIIKSCDLDIS